MHNKKQYLLVCFRSELFLIYYKFVQLISFLCNLVPWWLNWYPGFKLMIPFFFENE